MAVESAKTRPEVGAGENGGVTSCWRYLTARWLTDGMGSPGLEILGIISI